jgi:two-component system CheB/CheR fusion protein
MSGDAPLDVLLEHLKRSRGFDFTGYKRATLERRVQKRMDAVGAASYDAYLDHLELHPDEFACLFNTILINVTAFFRDPQAWEFLAQDVLPRLLEAIPDQAPVRVWCAGCASGEEAYTTAMLLAEALGEPAYTQRVKLYATDVDEEALSAARQASYSAKAVEGVPPALLERYFDRVDQRWAFRKELRRSVIFGRNDLVQDAPISRIDLLTCRNTLMYLNAETQAQVLRRLNFALNDRGFLFLGKSEMLITRNELFRPVDLKRRVFQRVVRTATLRERLLQAAHGNGGEAATEAGEALRDGVFDAAPVAQVVVDADGLVVMVNQQARDLFHVSAADLGRPLKDLELSYRPVDLRSSLDVAFAERRAVVMPSATATVAGGDVRELEVHVTPLAPGGALLGATVAFHDVTGARRLQDELDGAKRDLETAYEELQSTVEELETTNEELQSTNEELETTNEELQSTNEELETINDELRVRTLELNEVNAFLESILTSMGIAVVVVDRDQVVRVWNGHAEDLWGLRPDQVEGRHLLGLDIGLPLDGVKSALLDVLAGREGRSELVLDARNRRGRDILCRVTLVPLVAGGDAVTGAIVLMEELDRALEIEAAA